MITSPFGIVGWFRTTPEIDPFFLISHSLITGTCASKADAMDACLTVVIDGLKNAKEQLRPNQTTDRNSPAIGRFQAPMIACQLFNSSVRNPATTPTPSSSVSKKPQDIVVASTPLATSYLRYGHTEMVCPSSSSLSLVMTNEIFQASVEIRGGGQWIRDSTRITSKTSSFVTSTFLVFAIRIFGRSIYHL